MKQKTFLDHILQASKWSLLITQYGSIALSIYVLVHIGIPLMYGWLILFGYILLAWVGIATFYHRKISHGSFKLSKILLYPGIFLGVIAGRGDPLGWSLEHRRHHTYADTDKDPHSGKHYRFKDLANPVKMKYGDNVNLFIVRDLLKDPFIRFVSEYYNLFLIGMLLLCMIFPIFFYIWLIPMALTHIALVIFVFISHKYGYRNYDISDNSRNNWFASILFGGEGWENNHHYNERSPYFKNKWWEIDPVGHLISIIRLKNK